MSGTELSESKAAPALAKCMVELARMADKAEALEAFMKDKRMKSALGEDTQL